MLMRVGGWVVVMLMRVGGSDADESLIPETFFRVILELCIC